MSHPSNARPPSRRDLLKMIGLAAGSSTMLHAMSSLGHARQSPYKGPLELSGAPQGRKVVVLGAGLAGMCAALELSNAGYEVQIIEYQKRAGGRCWTLKGGDEFEELGGGTQKVEFSKGQYINTQRNCFYCTQRHESVSDIEISCWICNVWWSCIPVY